MKIQTIISTSIIMVIEPENTMEEEILKLLLKQSVELQEVRGAVMVLGKTIKGSLLLAAKDAYRESPDETSQIKTPPIQY